jgi:hypothetical protein
MGDNIGDRRSGTLEIHLWYVTTCSNYMKRAVILTMLRCCVMQ